MSAALFGLVVAIATACAYVLLTERMDYASVARRQLDAWAAIAAMACLAGILFGGVEARSEAILRAEASRRAVSEERPIAIPRLVESPLGRSENAPDVVEDADTQVLPAGEVEVSAAQSAADVVDSGDGPGPSSDDDLSSRPVSIDPPEVDEPTLPPVPAPAAEGWVAPTVVVRQPGPSGIYAPTTPTPLPAERPARAVVITAVPPKPTSAPPTATQAPTEAPTVPPAPTAFCGDPGDIRVVLDVDAADADRRSDPQGIRYRSSVRNDSAFPLTLTGIVVTAQDSRSGSDQFGSDRRVDVHVDPGATTDLSGIVKLDKYPSPFGRSQLCISFAAETCGRRSDQRPVTRRCVSISGF